MRGGRQRFAVGEHNRLKTLRLALWDFLLLVPLPPIKSEQHKRCWLFMFTVLTLLVSCLMKLLLHGYLPLLMSLSSQRRIFQCPHLLLPFLPLFLLLFPPPAVVPLILSTLEIIIQWTTFSWEDLRQRFSLSSTTTFLLQMSHPWMSYSWAHDLPTLPIFLLLVSVPSPACVMSVEALAPGRVMSFALIAPAYPGALRYLTGLNCSSGSTIPNWLCFPTCSHVERSPGDFGVAGSSQKLPYSFSVTAVSFMF